MNAILFVLSIAIIVSVFPLFTTGANAQWTIPSQDLSQNQNVKTSTYENSDSSIKIDYPSDWYYLEKSGSDIEFYPSTAAAASGTTPATAGAATTTGGSTTGQSDATIKLTVTPLNSNPVSINSIVDETLKDKSKTLENFLLLDSAIIPDSKDKVTQKLIYSYTGPDNSKIVQLDYGTIKDNKLYLLSFIADTKKFYDYVHVADSNDGFSK